MKNKKKCSKPILYSLNAPYWTTGMIVYIDILEYAIHNKITMCQAITLSGLNLGNFPYYEY